MRLACFHPGFRYVGCISMHSNTGRPMRRGCCSAWAERCCHHCLQAHPASFKQHDTCGSPQTLLEDVESDHTVSSISASGNLIPLFGSHVHGKGRKKKVTCIPRLRSQNWQSAAPPAMVPSRNGLISMTFFTVCEAACQHGYHQEWISPSVASMHACE